MFPTSVQLEFCHCFSVQMKSYVVFSFAENNQRFKYRTFCFKDSNKIPQAVNSLTADLDRANPFRRASPLVYRTCPVMDRNIFQPPKGTSS